MIIIDKNAKREVQVKYPDRTRVLFPNLDDGYISSNDVVIPGINAPISDDGVGVASINDGAEGNAISKLVIGIDPVQDLHGQSNPYPPGGGKNLLNVTATTQTVSGVTFTVNSDGSIKANGTATADIDFTVGTYTLKAGTAIKYNGSTGGSASTYWVVYSGYQKAGSGDGTADRTASETDWTDAPLYIGIAEGTTVTNQMFYPMIRLASVADGTFAPYSNICPISGWTEAKVTRVGKNLFDASHTVNNKFTNSIQTAFEHYIATGEYATGYTTNGTSLGNNASYMTSFTPIKEDMEYVVKNTTSGSNLSMVCFLDDSGNVISHNIGWSSNAYVHTALSNEKYIMIGMKVAEKDAVIIAVGSTVPDVEPYNGQTYTIDLDGTIYGGTLDVTTGVLTVDRAMVTLNGSESWSTNSATTGLYYLTISGIKNATGHIKSNMFKETTVSGVNMVVGEMKFVSPNVVNFKTSYATLAEWKTALASNNVQLLYKLAEPFEVTLTGQDITTLLGQNNIWADCGVVLELSYSANMNIRLQDLLNEKLDKPTIPGTLGQVLTSDGEGGQTWETPE